MKMKVLEMLYRIFTESIRDKQNKRQEELKLYQSR
jgi:hypothetical protein